MSKQGNGNAWSSAHRPLVILAVLVGNAVGRERMWGERRRKGRRAVRVARVAALGGKKGVMVERIDVWRVIPA